MGPALAIGLLLTDPGRTALTALASTVDKTRVITADGISEQRYAQTLETLERMARNLEWTDPTPHPRYRRRSNRSLSDPRRSNGSLWRPELPRPRRSTPVRKGRRPFCQVGL